MPLQRNPQIAERAFHRWIDHRDQRRLRLTPNWPRVLPRSALATNGVSWSPTMPLNPLTLIIGSVTSGLLYEVLVVRRGGSCMTATDAAELYPPHPGVECGQVGAQQTYHPESLPQRRRQHLLCNLPNRLAHRILLTHRNLQTTLQPAGSPRPAGTVAYDNTGCVVLVTGGAQGIGLAICRAFAQSGATVVCADILSESSDLPPEVKMRPTDTGKAADCHAAVQWTIENCGGLDVLVNNAAIQPRFSYVPVDQLESDLAECMVAINFMGYTYMAQYAGGHEATRQWGGCQHCQRPGRSNDPKVFPFTVH